MNYQLTPLAKIPAYLPHKLHRPLNMLQNIKAYNRIKISLRYLSFIRHNLMSMPQKE